MNSGDDAAVLAGTDADTEKSAETAEAAGQDEIRQGEGPAAETEAGPDTSEPAASETEAGDGGEGGGGEGGGEGTDGVSRVTGAKGAPIWLATVTVLTLALIAGIVVAVNYVGKANEANATASGEKAVLAVTSTVATDLTTTDYKDPGSYIAKLKPLAVGSFLNTYENAGSGLASILAQGKVQTSGHVVEQGIKSYNAAGGTATVEVLVDATVKNVQHPQGVSQSYRMNMSLIKSGGQWLVSNVEYVN